MNPFLNEIHQSIRCYVGIRLNENHTQSIGINPSVKSHFVILFIQQLKCFAVILTDSCDDRNLMKYYFLFQYLI